MDSKAPLPTPPRDRRGLLFALAFVAVVGALVVAVRGSDGAPPPARTVGRGPVAFALPMLGGASLDLEADRGKVVVLDFWATWCHPCAESMPAVARVGRELADRGVVTVAVNRDTRPAGERESAIRRFLRAHGLEGLKVALDDGTAARVFGIRGLPTTVVLGRDGRVAAIHVGILDEQGLRELLRPLLVAG